MDCLPLDGRWQTEAQLIGQTQLGIRTCSIYRELVRSGLCENKVVPVICGWSPPKISMQMFRVTWQQRQAFWKLRKAAFRDYLPV
jgi:hypothetical protein